MQIVYRHYQKDDDEQLAFLYNIAFQMNGASFVRTPRGWNWRYVQSPSFEPEMIQIAEDVNEKRIVGAIHINPIEKLRINEKSYLFGEVNDVVCHPDYTKNGIASQLLERSILYMKKKDCDFSLLTADANGFARKKLYLKNGFKDVSQLVILVNFPNILRLIRDFYGFMIFSPILFILSYVPRIISRYLIRKNPFFKDINYEILFNKNHFIYAHARDKIMSKYYSAYPVYNKNMFKWARINTPAKIHHPTYIIMRKNTKIVGGAVFTRKNIYSFKHGIKLRMAIIHEIFLDKHLFKNKENIHYGYKYLIEIILKAAKKRNISFILHSPTKNDGDLIKSFKSMNFLKFSSAKVMIKDIKVDFKSLFIKKPLFIPTHVSLAFP